MSRRADERRIDKLLDIIAKQNDRIMYLAGREWAAPPVAEPPAQPVEEFDEQRYALIPEQADPDAYDY